MSDLLIKNVELPKNGRLVLAVCFDGAVYRYFGDKNKQADYRIDSAQEYLPNSPAIEVPPHGRLGDLDKLYEVATAPYGNLYGFEALIKDIKNAPTVLEATE